ncbi:recombination regulator RecX [Alkalibacillus haloalkaliphilus]|uniref:recombination regulator RecX n=1 Tax=Alkalibacillus haloalkaliphilus TaxID=94136 RepID=UPI0002EDF6B0|nr:recombination regulator RecX [Alkalibacillus haloalkaliphilus]
MKKISKITKQKKNQQRYNVFYEKNGQDEFAFGIHEDLLVRFELRKGLELSSEEVRNIEQQDAMYRYYTLTLNYLSYRMRAKSEIIEYLQKKEATEQDIAYVIERLQTEKLLDDVAFAEAYVRTKMNTSMNGPNKIRQELYQKKLTEHEVEQGLSHYTKELEIDKLVKLIEKKVNASRKKSFKEHVNSLKQSLIQKGFTHDAIEIALQSIELSVDEDEEYEALKYQGEKAWRKFERKHEGFQLQQKVKASLFQKGFPAELIEQYINEKSMEEEV